MIELIPVPTRPGPNGYRPLAKYDYVSVDGRWRVEKRGCCGGPMWAIIDTTGEVFSVGPYPEGHRNEYAALRRKLSGAKAFIAEWSTSTDLASASVEAEVSGSPTCPCGQPLWAPISQQRGHCEACHLRAGGHSSADKVRRPPTMSTGRPA